MPLTVVPLNIIESHRELNTEPPADFAAFIKALQGNSRYARKPLTYQMSQTRATNQPPPVKTMVIELLNHMSSENVQRTIDGITKIKLMTDQDLDTLGDLLFKFATTKQDARMSRVYADLIKGLSGVKVRERKLLVVLLNRCQTEFALETQTEIVERKELMVNDDDESDAESISRAFKMGLVQLISTLAVNGVLRSQLFDRSVSKMLDCCDEEGDKPINIRIEAALKMITIASDRYKAEVKKIAAADPNKPADPEVVKNLARIRAIKAKKYEKVGPKVRMGVLDLLDIID